MTDTQKQIEQALANERDKKSKSDSKRALIGVFVIIPTVIVLFVAGWIVVRLMNGG